MFSSYNPVDTYISSKYQQDYKNNLLSLYALRRQYNWRFALCCIIKFDILNIMRSTAGNVKLLKKQVFVYYENSNVSCYTSFSVY